MSKKRIVIADDEPDTLKIWVMAFRANGYEVQEATNGLDALQLIQQTHPNAALLDFMMPGLDGIAVCEQVRQTDKRIFIVIVSGVGSERLKQLSQEASADQYLEKPVKLAQLAKVVEAGLAKQDSEAG